MKAKTLRRLVSVLAALVMAVSLLAGCGTKTAEQVQEQEDAQTIQVYLWSTSLYETTRSNHSLEPSSVPARSTSVSS